MAPVLVIPECLRPLLVYVRNHVQLGDLGVPTEELKKMDMRSKLRAACLSWARDGLGSPVVIHVYYLLKVAVYLFGFWLFQSRGSGGQFWRRLRLDLDFRRDAFRRFVIYNLLFEVLGLGCGSGPLTGKLIPPHTAWYHFLCPGTLKLPMRSNPRDSRRPLLPFLSTVRTKFDVFLFASYLAALLRALTARKVTAAVCRPVVGLLSALAVVDHTVFLASRGDVYGYFAMVQATGGGSTGAQLVQLAVYTWAGISKLGPWFQHVIQVMLSNSPCFPAALRGRLYRDLERYDFRASPVAKGLASMGTAMEVLIPALVPFGGYAALLGMAASISMHTFIFTNFAVGCPQEWNVFTPIAVYHLFLDAHDGLDWQGVRRLPSSHPKLSAFLASVLVLVPTLGSFRPQTNSFLTSMKYYAGNWPITVWLVKKSAWHKFGKLHTLGDTSQAQMTVIYGADYAEVAALKIYAFRALHLPYKCLPELMEAALQGRSFDEYIYTDGETMAGAILGYNFGDGYLHGRFMVQAVQDICKFEKGELLHISIDSCPAHASEVPWSVRDATLLWDDSAAIAIGSWPVRDLEEKQPY